VTDAEMGLYADRAWQVEFGDRWRERKEEHFARRARESQQDRERERRQKQAELERQKEAEFERQAAEFAEGVARDVEEIRATFRDMQATLAENARLREERERRLEDWAIEDAWVRLRGKR